MQCQKSMARIKQVISERRHAALEAAEILRSRGQLDDAARVEDEARVAQEVVQNSDERAKAAGVAAQGGRS